MMAPTKRKKRKTYCQYCNEMTETDSEPLDPTGTIMFYNHRCHKCGNIKS